MVSIKMGIVNRVVGMIKALSKSRRRMKTSIGRNTDNLWSEEGTI